MKTFIQKPKQVAVVSLIVALVIGYFGYKHIHKDPEYTYLGNQTEVTTGSDTNLSKNISLGFLTGGRIKTVSVKTGDKVKKGDVLATLDAGNVSGQLTQARAAYANAQANYQKVINGATGATVDVAKAALNTAKVNLDEVTKQQNVLVANARRTMLNSGLVAENANQSQSSTAPTVLGSYSKDVEGSITITPNQSGDGGYFTFSGLVNGTGKISSTSPQALGDTGLSLQFASTANVNGSWIIKIPNTTASNYLSNYNAYQSALQAQSQTIASLQAAVDQATANLAAVVTAARPEDVAVSKAQVESALGSLQIAEAAYNATVIVAPENGVVTAVSISAGQIATPNTAAIDLVLDTPITSTQITH